MLSAFPHLTDSEFDEACVRLVQKFQQQGCKQDEWLSVELVHQNETKHLRITKALSDKQDTPVKAESESDIDEIEEHDQVGHEFVACVRESYSGQEALSPSTKHQAIVLYDIVLSPTYRVPVLYISISDPQHRYPPTMATLYEQLVPPDCVSQTHDVGVMGGITIADHPATNSPVFFVHPCRTAEVMEASVEKNTITAAEYLMLWIGALGKCVGLNVPLALARHE